jgi:hypothetical protein
MSNLTETQKEAIGKKIASESMSAVIANVLLLDRMELEYVIEELLPSRSISNSGLSDFEYDEELGEGVILASYFIKLNSTKILEADDAVRKLSATFWLLPAQITENLKHHHSKASLIEDALAFYKVVGKSM